MPLSASLHKALKEHLRDNEFDGKKLIEVISEINDRAEAKDKVQKANDDISAERDKLKDEIKSFKAKVAEFENTVKEKEVEVETLKSNQLTPEERKQWMETKQKGMTAEVEAQINRLTEDIKVLKGAVESEQQKSQQAEQKAKEAKMSTARTSLENKITKALADKKITGNNADIALAIMEKQGLFKLAEKDGEYIDEFYTKNDSGGILTANISELADYVATKHENLVDSSGRIGGGINHSSVDPKAVQQSSFESLRDAKTAARDLMEADFINKGK